ncbi:MAG: hypothetical protein IPF93_19790 [Saprospiraceae bacterium]|nr:hypothetical protein [Saprospiraceae bacterium]
MFGDIPVGNLYFINTSDIKEGATARVYEYTVTLNGEPFRFKELNKKIGLSYTLVRMLREKST